MLYPNEVTAKMKEKALHYLMFLKHKRSGNVKGRGVTDGRKQKSYVAKEELSSPTVSLNASIATCIIDAIEGRNVTTIDIPGAFLQALWPKSNDCYVKFERMTVKIICRIDKRYEKCVKKLKDNNRKFMYGKLNRVSYGTILRTKFFFNKLLLELVKLGFEQNPCNYYTWNKMVNGKKLSVVFHVYNLKASHEEQTVLDKFIKQLKEIFGKQDKMLESTGLVQVRQTSSGQDKSLPSNFVPTSNPDTSGTNP